MYEIEMKFRVADPQRFLERMKAELQAEFGAVEVETDHFFQHCQRDFRQTDECLRIRQRNQNEYRITYKGPKLDPLTKSREEIELPLASLPNDRTFSEWRKLLERLGFQFFATLEKKRRKFRFSFANRGYEMTLDELSSIGFFTEIETDVDSDDPLERDVARAEIIFLANKLGLGDCVRRSYLGLFLDARQANDVLSDFSKHSSKKEK